MNLFQKVWAVLTQGSGQRSEEAERLERISQLEARHRALTWALRLASDERDCCSEGLDHPNQSNRVRPYLKIIKQYTTEQLQIEALLRELK